MFTRNICFKFFSLLELRSWSQEDEGGRAPLPQEVISSAVFEDGCEGGNFCESPRNGEKARIFHEREHGEYTRNESDRPRGRSDALKLVPAMECEKFLFLQQARVATIEA